LTVDRSLLIEYFQNTLCIFSSARYKVLQNPVINLQKAVENGDTEILKKSHPKYSD